MYPCCFNQPLDVTADRTTVITVATGTYISLAMRPQAAVKEP